MKAKMCIAFSLLAYFYSFHVSAQGLSGKTNEMQLNFKNNLPDTGPLPKIRWIQPLLDYTNSTQNRLELEAEVEAYQSVAEIKIILGSTDQGILATKLITTIPGQKNYKLNQRFHLPDGSNFISIEVKTREGVVVSDRRTILVGKNAEENLLAIDRKDYALLFAIDKYDHWNDLVNPIDDAHVIARELKEKYGFEIELVENPTVEEIWEKLREYNERKFKPQDQLFIFFAGHGHYDEAFGEGFVVAKNSLLKDVSRTTYLSHNRLRGVIGNIPSKHILLTMDVCFGGTLDPAISRSRGAENEVTKNEMVARKLRYKTRKYLTSGGKEYVSDGVPGKHSPFTEKLIESLRTIGGEDGVLTLAELQANLEKLKQLPRFGSFGDDESLSDFVFVGRKK